MFEGIAHLRSTRAKRIFKTISILLLSVELVLRIIIYYVYDKIPAPYSTILEEVLIHLIGATITGILLTGLLIYLRPIEDKITKRIELLEPKNTKSMHERALRETNFWYHRGHFGRWVRTTAMPQLSKDAIREGISKDIRVILLDPRNEELSKLYLEFRNGISFKDNNIQTIQDVQAELISTIIIGQLYNQDPSGLRVQMYLDNQLFLVREDVNSLCMFRTQVDPRCPAIVCYRSSKNSDVSEYYNVSLTEFEFACRTCWAVPAAKLPNGTTINSLNTSAINDYLTSINLLIKNDEEFLNNILQRIRLPYHHYN